MKTEELIKTFHALDARKRNLDVQFVTPGGKILDIDNITLLSSISPASDTPKLTFYVYLKEMQRGGQDTRDTTETSMLFQKVIKNLEHEKELTRLRENYNRSRAAVVYPRLS